MIIIIHEIIEMPVAIFIHAFLVVVQIANYHSEVEMDDEVGVALWRGILTYIQIAEDALKLVLLVQVIVVLEHGDGKALAESARAHEEEIQIRSFYRLDEGSLVNIVAVTLYHIFKILHAVGYALAVYPLRSIYCCHTDAP